MLSQQILTIVSVVVGGVLTGGVQVYLEHRRARETIRAKAEETLDTAVRRVAYATAAVITINALLESDEMRDATARQKLLIEKQEYAVSAAAVLQSLRLSAPERLRDSLEELGRQMSPILALPADAIPQDSAERINAATQALIIAYRSNLNSHWDA